MMQIAVEQGALLTFLTGLLDVKFAVEIGTFTGYSAISIARGLAPGGRLLCCDISEEWTGIARKYWQRAGVADKTSYRDYYEALLPKLSPRGIIVFDNVLWNGAVVDREKQDESTQAIRALNDFIAKDDRVQKVMLPVADGITLVRRR
jgi:caffeoyl-CoA O-methyltransferase